MEIDQFRKLQDRLKEMNHWVLGVEPSGERPCGTLEISCEGVETKLDSYNCEICPRYFSCVGKDDDGIGGSNNY